LGADVRVFRNDELSVDEFRKLQPERLVISPGPCTPNDAGLSMDLIRAFAGQVPILGVCLGHQSIAQVYGAEIIRAKKVMHGKTSQMHHDGEGVFSKLENPFTATRYHSLIIKPESMPDCLEITAWTQSEDGSRDEIMGVRHREFAIEGVQFHPESILTECGHDLLKNFLELQA
jgi:anthranilate synthase component 2